MPKLVKIVLLLIVCPAFVVFILFYPLPLSSFPEWKLQVVDPSGKPVSGERVHEEWTDPAYEGVTNGMEAETDSNGWVVFARHKTHVSLANSIFYPFADLTDLNAVPSAHAFVCMPKLTGDVKSYAAISNAAQQLVLHSGSCGLEQGPVRRRN
jgi:hypothetical protein